MDEVITQTKFDILRKRLSPTLLPISKDSKAKAEDLLSTSDFPTRKNEAWNIESALQGSHERTTQY